MVNKSARSCQMECVVLQLPVELIKRIKRHITHQENVKGYIEEAIFEKLESNDVDKENLI